MAEDSAAGSPPVLAVEEFLQPIPGDAPAGVDIRADATPNSIYYKIKDARAAARTAERAAAQAAEGVEAAPADWSPVLEIGPEILKEKAKDLEVAAWLIEALVRAQGFAGLRDGLRLARGLVEQFWDGLYPLPDEEGIPTRVAPLQGLSGAEGEGTLIQPILKVDVVLGSGPYATWQYQQALEIAKTADLEAREKKIAAGGVSMEAFEKAVRETPGSFFVTTKADIEACLEELAALTAALDAKAGEHTPYLGNIRTALDTCLENLGFFAKGQMEAGAAAAEAEAGGGEDIPVAGTAGGGGGGGGGGPLANREQAFKQLVAVAAFFRRTEPHSPLSYSLDQAVRWGRLPLPDLLKELIPDETARDMYFKLTGIRAEAAPTPEQEPSQ